MATRRSTRCLSRDYDLAVIDLGLPGMDGLALVRSLRRQLRGLPILVVTARDALEDRVSGARRRGRRLSGEAL